MPRLFVAIRPPASVRDALFDLMEGLPEARWQDDEQLHLTLRFAGEVNARMAEDLAGALARVAVAPFELSLRGVGAFDKRGRVHTLWAGIAPSPELSALQGKVERACRSCGLEAEHRKFAAHVTLARLSARSGAVAGWLAAHQHFASPRWTVDNFRLFESELGAQGASYFSLVRYTLTP